MVADPADLVPFFDVQERVVFVAAGATSVALVPNDPQRVALWFGQSDGDVYVSTLEATPLPGCIYLQLGRHPLRLGIATDGAIVQVAWFARSLGFPVNVTVITARYQPRRFK